VSDNTVSSDGTDRSKTKYGEQLRDKEWSEPRRDEGVEKTASVSSGGMALDVIYTFDPDENYGFGRRKYELIISPDVHDAVGWTVSFAHTHRWKGNYWRKSGKVDWADLPGSVKAKAAEILPVSSPTQLDPGMRVIEKHRSEDTDTDRSEGRR
jgi:hypothetical protein